MRLTLLPRNTYELRRGCQERRVGAQDGFNDGTPTAAFRDAMHHARDGLVVPWDDTASLGHDTRHAAVVSAA